MTYNKLAVWVTTFCLIGSAIGLSLDIRFGLFYNDRGFMFFFDQGALGLILAADGCWPNGIVTSAQLIESYSGLFSLPLVRLDGDGVAFQIPGIGWLLALSLVCILLFLHARRIRIRHMIIMKEAEQAGDGDAEEAV
jgi:hypothetical protein